MGDLHVVLRAMTEADLARVVAMEAASHGTPWPESSFREELNAGPRSRAVVAEEEADGGRRLMGHMVFWLYDDTCELMNVTVAPEARRRGLGRRLMEHLLGEARLAGCAQVFLDVRVGNAPARALYAEVGFLEVGRRRGYYSSPDEDAVLMSLSL